MYTYFFKKCQNFFQSGFPFYIPSVVYEHFSCSTSLPTLGIISLLNFKKFNDYILVLYGLIPSMINNVEHIFMYLLAICTSPFLCVCSNY